MKRGPNLPERVILPAVATARCVTVYDALNISKQTACNWRNRYGFPCSHNGRISVSDVAAWLVSRAVKCELV